MLRYPCWNMRPCINYQIEYLGYHLSNHDSLVHVFELEITKLTCTCIII